jgi:hypothetical protein
MEDSRRHVLLAAPNSARPQLVNRLRWSREAMFGWWRRMGFWKPKTGTAWPSERLEQLLLANINLPLASLAQALQTALRRSHRKPTISPYCWCARRENRTFPGGGENWSGSKKPRQSWSASGTAEAVP